MTEQIERTIRLEEKWKQAMSYAEYTDLIHRLLSHQMTTGENHSEAMIHYTQMNQHRMNRIEKYTKLRDDVKECMAGLKHPQKWLVLTEAWCGDAAQSLPVMHLMAEQSVGVEFRLLLRDEYPDLMNRFLYKGQSRSIPRLIILDEEAKHDLAVWGPRPEGAQLLFEEWMQKPDTVYEEVAEELQKWYARDRTDAIQKEIAEAVRKADEAIAQGELVTGSFAAITK